MSNHEMSYTSNEIWEKLAQNLWEPLGRRGIKNLHKWAEGMRARTPSPEPKTTRTSELNGSGEGRGKGIRWPRSFVLVGDTNRDKRVAFYPGWWLQPGQKARAIFCPGWCLQPGQNSLAPLSPSLSPRPSHWAHLFLLFLARDRGVLAHFFTTFVKIFDSPSIHRR